MPVTSVPPIAPRDPYAALRFRDFRLLISGRMIAQIGEMTVSVGIGWELYERTGDAFALGLVGLVQVIPVILFSLPGGYIADRYNRKRVTLISQIVLIICSLILALLSATQGDLLLIYTLLAIIGIARAFNNPAESALTPQCVPQEYYYNAATWNSTVWQTSAIIGPAVGGIVIGIAGSATPVYLLNALSGVVLVVALLLLRVQQENYESSIEPPMQALKKGWRFVRHHEVILGSISLDMFAVLFGGATFLLPVFAKDILMVDATGLGIMRAAPSIGALGMVTFLSRRPPFAHAGWTLLWAVAGFGIVTILFGISTSFWFSVLMLVAMGALDNISVVIRHTLVLLHTPDAMRGRVGAVNTVFIGTSNELGGFESGVAAAILGPVGAVVFGGIGTLAVVAIIGKLSPRLRRMKTLAAPDDIEDEVTAAPVTAA